MILITGGLGFIGSHLALQLLSRGQQVVLVDNLSNGNLQTLERLEFIAQMYIPFVKVDVRNTPALNKVFEQFSIQAVVHCAGFKSLSESNLKPLEYYNDNISCIMSLMRAMQRTGVRKLVHLSSLAAYGCSNAKLNEQTPFVFDYPNPYVKSQQMMESIIHDTFKTDNEWNIAVLRVANVAGAYENGILGETIPQLPKNIVSMAMQAAAGIRDGIELQDHHQTDDGTVERSFIHVLDVAEAIIASLHWLNNQQHVCEAFNIAHAETTSIAALLTQIQSTLGKTFHVTSATEQMSELTCLGAQCQHAQQTLNWQAQRDLKQMIEHQWRFYQNFLAMAPSSYH